MVSSKPSQRTNSNSQGSGSSSRLIIFDSDTDDDLLLLLTPVPKQNMASSKKKKQAAKRATANDDNGANSRSDNDSDDESVALLSRSPVPARKSSSAAHQGQRGDDSDSDTDEDEDCKPAATQKHAPDSPSSRPVVVVKKRARLTSLLQDSSSGAVKSEKDNRKAAPRLSLTKTSSSSRKPNNNKNDSKRSSTGTSSSTVASKALSPQKPQAVNRKRARLTPSTNQDNNTTSITTTSTTTSASAVETPMQDATIAAVRQQPLPPSTSSTVATALDMTMDDSDSDDDSDIVVWSGNDPQPAVVARSARESLDKPRSASSKHATTASLSTSDEDTAKTTLQQQTPLKTCWKCAVDLSLPDGSFCLYATHAHGVLNVPVCSVCADQVAAAAMEDANDDACAGCAKTADDEQDDGDDVLLFCCDADESVCGRVFCKECVARAHGNGAQGEARAQALQDDDSMWLCLACQPPALLQKLQLPLIASPTAASTNRTMKMIVGELCLVESEKRECEDIAETDVEKRSEIVEELSETLSGADLEESVNQELAEWKELMYKHDLRLSDTIGGLQDELETVHNVDLSVVYEQMGLQRRPSSVTADEERPAWAVEADRELDGRKKHAAPDPSNPSVYEKNIPTDVEDLASPTRNNDTSDDDYSSDGKDQWRQTNGKISSKQLAEALEFEASEFGIERPAVVSEAQDAKDMLAEEREVSMSCRGGRIRRDLYQIAHRAPSYRTRRVITASSTVGRNEHQEPARNERQEPGLVESPKHRSGCGSGSQSSGTLQPPSSALKESPPASSQDLSVATRSDMFARSKLILCSASLKGAEKQAIRTVAVARPLVKALKPHQVEGVHFIWKNSFSDFAHSESGDPSAATVGGCILAHNMGLGKSLTAIVVLHTVLNHPALLTTKSQPHLKLVLLVVPVNTVANWENEFSKWVGDLDLSIRVSNLMDVVQGARLTMMKEDVYKKKLQPDVLVLDEAHTVLSKTSNESYKALSSIQTPRRIALTGSPVQNNLLEYFRMVQWIRPGVFEMTEKAFDNSFVEPIMCGMAADASLRAVYDSKMKSNLLYDTLEPFVQRKDASELMKDLPPMQQVVLHIRQSRMQCRLYRSFKQFQNSEQDGFKNFLRIYAALRPINNHPGCLLPQFSKVAKADSSTNNSDSDATDEWWMSLFKSKTSPEPETLKDFENGFKIVLLLHILVMSEKLGDKVLVFSQCLKTLNFLEEVLNCEDWTERVSSLATAFPGQKLGSWESERDYLRIDGGTSSSERGDLIEKFNNPKEGIKTFLISSKAGGIGINLPAANRVVLFDSHFNPTVMTQAVFRAYRYGQKKEVFVYRLLTEGSIEDKVYSRSVNKTGMAFQVIDKKSIGRSFTAKELQAIQESYNWVQCDHANCEKWRLLPYDVGEEELPDKWFCSMNVSDPANNSCAAPERTQRWYEASFDDSLSNSQSSIKCMAMDASNSSSSQSKKLVANDHILQHILQVTEREKTTNLVSRHYFHELLLESKENSKEEMDTVREAMEAEVKLAAASPVPDSNSTRDAQDAVSTKTTADTVKLASVAKSAPLTATEEAEPVSGLPKISTDRKKPPIEATPATVKPAPVEARPTPSKRAFFTSPSSGKVKPTAQRGSASSGKAASTPSKRPGTGSKSPKSAKRAKTSLEGAAARDTQSPVARKSGRKGVSTPEQSAKARKKVKTPTSARDGLRQMLSGPAGTTKLRQQKLKMSPVAKKEMSSKAATKQQPPRPITVASTSKSKGWKTARSKKQKDIARDSTKQANATRPPETKKPPKQNSGDRFVDLTFSSDDGE